MCDTSLNIADFPARSSTYPALIFLVEEKIFERANSNARFATIACGNGEKLISNKTQNRYNLSDLGSVRNKRSTLFETYPKRLNFFGIYRRNSC